MGTDMHILTQSMFYLHRRGPPPKVLECECSSSTQRPCIDQLSFTLFSLLYLLLFLRREMGNCYAVETATAGLERPNSKSDRIYYADGTFVYTELGGRIMWTGTQHSTTRHDNLLVPMSEHSASYCSNYPLQRQHTYLFSYHYVSDCYNIFIFRIPVYYCEVESVSDSYFP
ncbi:uncharacterized protein LOC130508778 isoform X2 [Raphanus sativus]|uniref:Uncharacterized protein LOC130508778 isoform X2 n=1 Tax=Raphanus sativus TaxID=3726 RepID=A0A9W3D9E7_RAPSA|nr:uncharacterized protein LOC130508778 isoform X2 [Raphanus sativus]